MDRASDYVTKLFSVIQLPNGVQKCNFFLLAMVHIASRSMARSQMIIHVNCLLPMWSKSLLRAPRRHMKQFGIHTASPLSKHSTV